MATSKILQTKNADIEWKVGTLVIRENALVVVVTSDDNEGRDFIGTVVVSDEDYRPVGFHYRHWSKKEFHLFEGRIEISNI